MNVEKKYRERGQTLSLTALEQLKILIGDKIQGLIKKHDGTESEHDIEIFERYEANPQDISVRRELIGRIPGIGLWIRKLASAENADPRSINKYVTDPQLLDSRIEVLKKSGGTARVLQGEARQVFVEGVRLLSTTIYDLVRYLPDTYIQYNHPIFSQNDNRPKMDVRVSRSTFANEARLCFDTTGSMTVKQMQSDQALQEVIEKNLCDWPVGTVGVHAVDVLWQMDHDSDRSRMQDGKKGGTMILLLMAERKKGYSKETGFSAFSPEEPDSEKASKVKEFLESLSTPANLVRMTCSWQDGQAVPTAMNKSVLKETLGSMAQVELDVPTRGLGPIRVKGRYKSEQDLYKFLVTLLG